MQEEFTTTENKMLIQMWNCDVAHDNDDMTADMGEWSELYQVN